MSDTPLIVEIPSALGGERVDRVVALLSGRTRAQVARLIAAGGVRVGGVTVASASRRVQVDEILETDLQLLVPSDRSVPAAAAPGEVLFRVVYDDEAYGAEVHHFGPDGHPLDTVMFPAADLAAIGRGFGCEGVTVREPGDLGPVRAWLDGRRDRPLLIAAKVVADRGSWWLEEAFRGH